MNHETLERLFIDCASGELSPDVAALLDAYVRHEPELAGEAEQIRETLSLAKLALAESPTPPLPEIDFSAEPALAAAEPNRPKLPTWAYGIGMAACFVGGLVIALLVLPAKNPAPVAKISLDKQPVATTSPVSSFWSIQHLHPNAMIASSGGDQVIWKSPVRKPEIRRPL